MTLDSMALACHRDEPRRFSRRPPWRCLRAAAFGVGVAAVAAHPLLAQERASARDLGIVVGVLAPGPLNAITDVVGVRVGHVTISRGDSINTGVTAILPHGANIFREKVPAAAVVGNGFGKLAGFTQVQELGELESPVVLTCTLCVPRVADAVMTYLLSLPGNENVRSVNPVVGETNDGFLNKIRTRPVTEQDVLRAIGTARGGPVTQGSVGAGRGTIAFGWKGGIGSSSRVLPNAYGGWTIGVLVQSNHGGVLTINGAPVGEALGRVPIGQPRRYPPAEPDSAGPPGADESIDGSIIIVVATDAPLTHRNLERLARRALLGMGRGGATMSNGSGDYVIGFSTVPVTRRSSEPQIPNEAMSPLFQAVIEATEEAIYNSMFLATTVRGYLGTIEALPIDSVLAIMRRHGAVQD